MRLILASGSPRRAELLRAAGFTFDVIVADVDERTRDGEDAATYVRRLAAEKSAAAQAALKGCATTRSRDDGPPKGGHYVPRDGPPRARQDSGGGSVSDVVSAFRRTDANAIILAADTAVVVDGEILGKPRGDHEAAAMLWRLSGRWHEVMTGISLRAGARELGAVETTRVQVASLSEADVRWYVASGEGRDKAGAYAIQGLASRFIPRIEGSYTNVVGLPTATVTALLVEIRRLAAQST